MKFKIGTTNLGDRSHDDGSLYGRKWLGGRIGGSWGNYVLFLHVDAGNT